MSELMVKANDLMVALLVRRGWTAHSDGYYHHYYLEGHSLWEAVEIVNLELDN